MDVILLWIFITNIKYYEEGVYEIIKYYTKTYTFKNNKELYNAINLWLYDRNQCITKYGHISFWDVSRITNMQWLFCNCYHFNQDISRWDVVNVKNMRCMFFSACSFNQNISSWNISNVTNTTDMFDFCHIKKQYKPKIGNKLLLI